MWTMVFRTSRIIRTITLYTKPHYGHSMLDLDALYAYLIHTHFSHILCELSGLQCSGGSRISRRRGRQPRRGGANSRGGYVSKILYVKTKESGPLGGGARRQHPPWIRHCNVHRFKVQEFNIMCLKINGALLPEKDSHCALHTQHR